MPDLNTTRHARSQGAVAPLGTITESAAASNAKRIGFRKSRAGGAEQSSFQGSDRQKALRQKRYRLQDAAAKLLPGHRVARCLRRQYTQADGSRSTVRLHYDESSKSAHYSGLFVCGNAWACAVCAAKISEKNRAELEHAIAYWLKQGGSVYLFTFTFSHTKYDRLGDQQIGELANWVEGSNGKRLSKEIGLLPNQYLKDRKIYRYGVRRAFLDAQRALWGEREYRGLREYYGLKHSIKAVEVTLGVNGWHIHSHVLVFADRPAPRRNVQPHKNPVLAEIERLKVEKFEAELESAIYPVWERVAARFGLSMTKKHGFDVKVTQGAIADYVAKFGREPKKRRAWGAEDELTKANTKVAGTGGDTPFGLLEKADVGDTEAAARFAEYVGEMYGVAQLMWSPGLRAAVGLTEDEQSDEEKARSDESVPVLLTLDDVVWFWVVRAHARQQLLDIASTGSRESVIEFLRTLRKPGDSPGFVQRE